MNKLTIAACILASVLAAPSSAADDMAVDESAQATAEIKKFHNDLSKQERALAGYDKMTEAEQDLFDADQKKWQTARKDRDDKEYTLVGYADMSTLAQATFNSELLAWKKEMYQACNEAPESDTCMSKDKMREYVVGLKNAETKCVTAKDASPCTEVMVTNGKNKQVRQKYFDLTTETKAAWATANKADIDQKMSSLVAAAVSAPYVPAAGARKSSCEENKSTKKRGKCNRGLCCGTATSGTGAAAKKKDICNWSGNTKFTETKDKKATAFTFKCVGGAGDAGTYLGAAITALAGLYLTV